MKVLDIIKMQCERHIHLSFMLLPNILDNIVVRVNQHKKGKRANKWLYQNANNIIAGTTGKKTQSGIWFGVEKEKASFARFLHAQ